ncbi:hypothetical protein KSF_073210 [Reticulibacter mediterranei]|uniref:Alcohol dehydrogenase-like N-terminal domain-containing protein n=1 Tax=Reticulibacter mediterranei TaxID=2778369 RepID=A0A8J3IRI3_9CHLR|nr:alcohol dehydrogenase catalytic domain-containing protein [Reticulibacter mediterranei]GHO97273.1 hypothetical protein KSF_073210 [Reticulibacter mediterranei]
MPATFHAFIVNKTEESFSAALGELSQAELPAGEVLIKVAYSGVNYKDGLASSPEGKVVVRTYPMMPGIDLAGVVEESSDARFRAGDEVIVTSYDLGGSHYGGFSEYARQGRLGRRQTARANAQRGDGAWHSRLYRRAGSPSVGEKWVET